MTPANSTDTGDPGVATRSTALAVLARVDDDGAYANLALSAALDASGLEGPDRGLVTDLVYGTLRHRRSADFLVDRFLTSDPPPSARRALRLGAYQLARRPDIPTYAVVDTTVAASPKRFRRLVNAVLRRVADADPASTEYPDEPTRLSYPDWIVERLRADLATLGPDAATDALSAMNQPAQPTARPDGYVQDLASQWVAALVEARPGDRVVDVCAAPGGKATALARVAGLVAAADLQQHRVGLIARNARGLGLDGVRPVVADGRRPPFAPGSADRVLLDAPCSGLGVLRRRPDARWRLDPAAPERLASLQVDLVDAAVPLIRPGGTLVYSVCTLTDAESTGVDDHIATVHPDLEPVDPPGSPWQPWGRGAILLPQAAGTDGMCIFRYRRGRSLPSTVRSPMEA